MELARLREEEEKLEALRERKNEYQRQLTIAVNNRLVVRRIRDLENYVENIKYNMRLQQLVIKQQEERVEAARQKMDDAMKERKTYEKLKEKAFEEFLKELDATERKEVDELTSFRYQNASESED